MKIELFSAFLALYWLCLCNHVLVVSSLCLDDQRLLLIQLKNNFTFVSESSSKLKSLNASHDCCRWRGVSCDKEGHFTALDLSGESISGGFDYSSALFSLQHLQKLNLAANNFNSAIPSGFNKLEKLTYLNLSNAGFVGQIPIEISQLTSLVTLDISCSYFYLTGQELKLEKPNLPMFLQNLTSIRQLYLDGVSISAAGHEWCSPLLLLHDLQELRMSKCNLSGPLDPSLATHEKLSVIVLDQNNLSSPVPDTFANSKNLTILSLAYCWLTGTFPQRIFSIGTLSVIDISFNSNLHGFFPDFPLSGSLQTLRVGNTSFSGAFPNSIGNMRNLSELDCSYCQFNGTLPNSLSNLSELSYLDLSFNNFTGQMPSFGMAEKLTHLDLSNNGLSGGIPSSSHFEGLNNLVSIDLSYNSIDGSIPPSLFTLPRLQRILLSNNQFDQLDEFINVSFSKLENLDLSSNHLSGPFPTSIFQLSTLSILQLSSNKCNGSIHLNKLLELRNLTTLDLSYNNLSVYVDVSNVDPSPFPSIGTLKLASCNLKTFPDFLKNQSILNSLDLSDNQIQGIVPNWIWKLQNLQNLNISHNLLTHLEGPLQNPSSKLSFLDLHHNKLQGPIPALPGNTLYLDLSNNNFSSIIREIGNYLSFTFFLSLSNNTLHGSIPNSLCKASYLEVLDLSNNNISGAIPSCFRTMSETLGVLNMRNNNFMGTIPDMFSASCALRTLDLYNNKLDGMIPKSLANCTKLEVLDLGKNEIIDAFPCFLKNISTLRVLVLRENQFYGHIGCPNTNSTWHMLQIIDLAINNFSGKIPGNSFMRWEAMMSDESHVESKANNIRFQFLQFGEQIYYLSSVTIVSKGLQMELVKILTIFTSIDFSSNHFEGLMPKELVDLKALHVLNLSNNALSGEIPSSIGNLAQLESLDLSQNSLSGEIPKQLASLSFLSYLNLSFNHLVGKIPTGTQLQSFQASSFEGNDQLYGPPLTGKPYIKEHGQLPHRECGRLVRTIDWNFISVELGFFFSLGIDFLPLLIWKQWRVCYWQLIHKILCWIFPRMYLDYTTQRGETHAVLRWRY